MCLILWRGLDGTCLYVCGCGCRYLIASADVGTSDLTTLLSACVCLSLKAKKLYKPKLLRKIVHKCYMQVREI
jgi:hypothetical protein